jgi:curli biogenesis system outer membrane secretion channel CsgG
MLGNVNLLGTTIIMVKFLALLITISLLGGCTSATRGELNTPIAATVKNTSLIDSQEEINYLKRLVAIGRFSDETKRSHGLFVDKNNNRLGKQASDILSARLTASGKFIMLERPDAEIISHEDASEKMGADFLILGSVSEYGRETTSEVGVFSRNKVQKAHATVNVRLVDVKTSRIIHSSEATGEATSEANRVFGVGETAAYNSALDDKAISAAISKLVSNLMNNLLDSPWQTYLLSHDSGVFFMSGGSAQGVIEGDIFNVVLRGKMVKNPQTGAMIELPTKKVAQVKVSSFVGAGENELSLASVVSGYIDVNLLSSYRVREITKN